MWLHDVENCKCDNERLHICFKIKYTTLRSVYINGNLQILMTEEIISLNQDKHTSMVLKELFVQLFNNIDLVEVSAITTTIHLFYKINQF